MSEDSKDLAAILSLQDYTKQQVEKLFGLTSWDTPLSVPVPTWLVPGLLQRAAIHILSSDSGTCKTWLALNLFLAGFTNIPTLGIRPTTPFSSIYLAADSPAWDIGQQARKLLAGNRVPIPATDVGSFIMPAGFHFDNDVHVGALLDFCRHWDIDAIFIDVMLYTHSGDENDNAYMARTVLRNAKLLRDKLGIAVFFLHHNAKPKPDMPTNFRGAGTIVQAAEHHFALSRDGSAIKLVVKKIRGDHVLPEEVLFSLQSQHDGCVLQPVAALGGELPVTAAVRAIGGQGTRLQIADKLGSIRNIDSKLQYAKRIGQLVFSGGYWCLPTPQS